MPKAKANPKQTRNNSGATNNIILAITNPMPKFSYRREPCLVVRDYTGDLEALIQVRAISDLRDQAMKIWRARASMKHTTTTTVRETSRSNAQSVDPNHYRHSSFGIPEIPGLPGHWELTENPNLTLGEDSLPLNLQLLN